MSSMSSATDDEVRNHTLTKRLVITSVIAALLVIIPMAALALFTWIDLERYSDDPLAGLGFVIAFVFSAPALVGTFVSLLGLIWRSRVTGPVLAGAGLGINVITALGVASMWLPALV